MYRSNNSSNNLSRSNINSSSNNLSKSSNSSNSFSEICSTRKSRTRNSGWRSFPFLRRIFSRRIIYSRLSIGFLVFFNILYIYYHCQQRGGGGQGNDVVITNGKNNILPKTTIVLMGYTMKRIDNYERILPAYGAMDKALDRVIFLWNSKFLCLEFLHQSLVRLSFLSLLNYN